MYLATILHCDYLTGVKCPHCAGLWSIQMSYWIQLHLIGTSVIISFFILLIGDKANPSSLLPDWYLLLQ